MTLCKVTVDTFPAITHVDKTCRLQTVTEQQNKFLYDLLETHPVLLNTHLIYKANQY